MLVCEGDGSQARCVVSEDRPGAPNGPCGPMGTCDMGYRCQDEVCVQAQGGEGQPCYPNRTCDEALRCRDDVCEACEPGALGCFCDDETSCDGSLICHQHMCVQPESLERAIPSDPQCFTPCRSSFLDGDAFRTCGADGLMEGCLDEHACDAGTCVLEGEDRPSCAGDSECPDHQLCIQANCYSTCEIDTQCPAHERCFRRACRVPCAADASSCSAGTHCQLLDSQHGFCMPLELPAAEMSRPQEGSYALSADVIELSNEQSSATLTLTNHSRRKLAFSLRRIEHTEYTDAGAQRETKEPMPWLRAGLAGVASKDVEVSLGEVPGSDGAPAGEMPANQVRIVLQNDAMGVPDRWDGLFEIQSEELGNQRIRISYAATPDGRWAGKVYYFGQFGDRNLDAWRLARSDKARLDAVGNAFVQKLGAFRRDDVVMTVEEFDAVLQSTVTESWRWPSTRALCPNGTCYLFAPSEPAPDEPGFRPYTDNPDVASVPVPTGLVELPIALDLKLDPDVPLGMTGRIVSDESLHYAADPKVTLRFATDAARCADDSPPGSCATYLDSFAATVVVGGRYRTTSGDSECAQAPSSNMDLLATPWLVPGFLSRTEADAQTGMRYSYECREGQDPYSDTIRNLSLAGANPIADGRRRERQLELVDGLLVNQNTFYILFRERFVEFLSATSGFGEVIHNDFYAYGFMRLDRATATLGPEAYEGSEVEPESANGSVDVAGPLACKPELVSKILGTDSPANPSEWTALVDGLLSGVPAISEAEVYDTSEVHYLCHANGLFDGGPDAPVMPVPCPADSHVTYFAAPSTSIPEDLSDYPCQASGTCQDLLDAWAETPPPGLRLNPIWRCTLDTAVFCSEHRTDLREGKKFYKPATGAEGLHPLRAAMEDAFRYRTQFRNRQGESLGFVPEICVPSSNIIPYCYDPAKIEEVRDRVDCLVTAFNAHGLELTQEVREDAKAFLDFSFGYEELPDPTLPRPVRNDGFELLNAELLIMLGDESYTRAFQSRFDLAGIAQVSFRGSLFEPDGIDLAGVAGYEMYTLYQASQYYQMVLDRFYALSPAMWQAIHSASTTRNFVSLETVVSYFGKVLRASAQKSRAWSEVGKRYQAMNRPQLARFALERAYTSAYLESLILTRTMQRVLENATAAERAQIALEIDKGQRTYKIALLDMREVYSTFTDDITYFGFPPDYVPMPALEPTGPDAFRTLFATAQQSVQFAASKEDLAINGNRAFNTDAAAFQGELVKIRNNYEAQLLDICGSFSGPDGRVYPAIRKYAYLDERARLYGDPCGLMGNGRLFEAMAGTEQVALDVEGLRNRYERVDREINIELERARAQCENTLELADYQLGASEDVGDLQSVIDASQVAMRVAERFREKAETLAKLSVCTVGTSTSCTQSAVATVVYKAASATFEWTQIAHDAAIRIAQGKIRAIERDAAHWSTSKQCDFIHADSNAKVRSLALEFADLELEALKTQYRSRLAFSDIDRLRNQATRLQAEQEDTEQLTINIEAARNDPNVRIYKNDAIINADRAFFGALQDAYRATKVYEYYTSQSYPRLDELTLVRLVSRGDYNLENYLTELADAFYDFEELYGRPDIRVDILSLRDDVLSIPRYDDANNTLSQSERIRRFRDAVRSSDLLDARGYVVIPFSTSLSRVSPLTRNHKLLYVEAELVGSDVGDAVGRVYVDQSGTSTVAAVDGSRRYLRFPARLAVLDTFFNGVRTFPPEVYRNDRLRDRPYGNTAWELVLNQRDEQVNQDIDLSSLSDIRLYLYYTDFTSL